MGVTKVELSEISVPKPLRETGEGEAMERETILPRAPEPCRLFNMTEARWRDHHDTLIVTRWSIRPAPDD